MIFIEKSLQGFMKITGRIPYSEVIAVTGSKIFQRFLDVLNALNKR